MNNQYKQYRVVNDKGNFNDFGNGKERFAALRDSLNELKPFIPHWMEYRFVDQFKIPRRPDLKPEPLKGKKDSSLCCRCFCLPGSPEEIEQAYMDFSKWETDIDKMAQMIIYIGEVSKNPYMLNYNVPHKDTFGIYTCKNLCRETGTCLDYENRPETCKGYPYDEADTAYCDHCTTKQYCNGVINQHEDKQISKEQ